MRLPFLIGAIATVAMLNGATHQEKPTLKIPEGQALLMTLRAKGVQVYTAKASANDPTTFEWSLKEPRATLYDQDGKKAGTHSAGPTWQLVDGSRVVGVQPPLQRVMATKPASIDWLLLGAKAQSGGLGRVTYILRVDTSGGTAPTKPPLKAGQETKVDYRATYVFLADGSEGGKE